MLKGLSLLALTEAAGSAHRQLKALPWFLAGALIGLFALAAILEATHGWLALRMSPVQAHLVIGLGLAVIAALFAAIGIFVKSRRQRRDTLATTALVAAPVAAGLARSSIAAPALAVAGVVAAGAVLGRYIAKTE